MSETALRCPVCPDQVMDKIEFQNPPLSLDSCFCCGGIWFEHDKMNLLKQVKSF